MSLSLRHIQHTGHKVQKVLSIISRVNIYNSKLHLLMKTMWCGQKLRNKHDAFKLRLLCYKLKFSFTAPLTFCAACCCVGSLLTCDLWERRSCFDRRQLWWLTSAAPPAFAVTTINDRLRLSLPPLPLSLQLHRRFFISYFLFCSPPSSWLLITSFFNLMTLLGLRLYDGNCPFPALFNTFKDSGSTNQIFL